MRAKVVFGMARVVDERAMELTTEIVVAFLNNGTIQPDRLPGLVEAIRRSLGSSPEQEPALGAQEQHSYRDAEERSYRPSEERGHRNGNDAESGAHRSSELVPAVPIEESVTRDYLISLEDGKRYRSLKRHLMAKYGMTPHEYRAKWGLPSDYPMVASSLAEARSRAAKLAGLGVRSSTAASAPRRRRNARKSRA